MYGGLDTITSYLPNLKLSILQLMNFDLFSRRSKDEFFFAISIAFFDLSIPIPCEFFKFLRIDNKMQPEPVPISKILIEFLCLYFLSSRKAYLHLLYFVLLHHSVLMCQPSSQHLM